MRLQTEVKTVGESPVWLDSTETLRFLVGGVTLDAAQFRAAADGKKKAPSGLPLGRLATGLYIAAINTTLAAAAGAGDAFIDVVEGDHIVPGKVLSVGGTNVTVAAGGVTLGGGAGGSDRVALTAAIGAAKNLGDTVRATDGSQSSRCILWKSVDLTLGNAAGGAIDHGRVLRAALPVTVSDDQVASLERVGITFT